jgi:flagellar hook-associated protein 1 FlgK
MSITSALITAGSGLAASARGAEVVAGNVANAGTEGYVRRELRLGTLSVGNGGAQVRILGIKRHSDPLLAADRRIAAAAAAQGDVRAAMFGRLETSMGIPGDGTGLTSRIAAFDAALIGAVGEPESIPKLTHVAQSAGELALSMREIAAGIQEVRHGADRAIAADVEMLNQSLRQIHQMNGQIRAITGQQRDPASLIDQRQVLIDGLSGILPLREIALDHNEVALFSTSGLVLLDGRPATFGFQPSPAMGASLSREGGGLSGLTVDGRPVSVDGAFSMIAGGSLAANFAVRDDLAPAQAAGLDLLAADLVQRLSDVAVDPTVDPALGGLFRDPGPLPPPQTDLGLAGRLVVNAAMDPAQGGEVWRIRAGAGAAGPGDPGDGALLSRMAAALAEARVPLGAGPNVPSRSLAGHAADVLSEVSSSRLSEARRASFASAREAGLRQIEAENSVDTDQEIQILMRIEKQYAANARVLSAVDEMLKRLMEL